MKRTIKQITLAVVIATVTTAANASWTDTVKGYWNSACTKAKSAAQTTSVAVSNWFVNTATLAKITCNKTITQNECTDLCNIITASTLSDAQKIGHVAILKRYQRKELGIEKEIKTTRNAIAKILVMPTAVTIATAATGIAMIYAYKRLTARPAIPGWCA